MWNVFRNRMTVKRLTCERTPHKIVSSTTKLREVFESDFLVFTALILGALIIFLLGPAKNYESSGVSTGLLVAGLAECVLVVVVGIAAIALPKTEVVKDSFLEPIGGTSSAEFFLGSGRTPHGDLELRYAVNQPEGLPAFEAVRATKSKIYVNSEVTPMVQVISHVANNPWLSPFGGEVFTTYRLYLKDTDILPGENLNLYIEQS